MLFRQDKDKTAMVSIVFWNLIRAAMAEEIPGVVWQSTAAPACNMTTGRSYGSLAAFTQAIYMGIYCCLSMVVAEHTCNMLPNRPVGW